MVRTIFWDNDGVLVDTEALYLRATQEVLATVGADLTTERFIRLSLEEGRSAFDLAREKGLTTDEVEQLRNTRNERYSELLRAGVPVFSGAEEVLRRLHGHVPMGIVTSSRRDHFEIIHRSLGLLSYFDFTLTRECYGKTKPHPDPYLAAIDHCRARPEECVVVEDSARGLLAARRAGIRCIVVPNELTREQDFEGAHLVVPDLRRAGAELMRLLAD